jgi:hypothetical protein
MYLNFLQNELPLLLKDVSFGDTTPLCIYNMMELHHIPADM